MGKVWECQSSLTHTTIKNKWHGTLKCGGGEAFRPKQCIGKIFFKGCDSLLHLSSNIMYYIDRQCLQSPDTHLLALGVTCIKNDWLLLNQQFKVFPGSGLR